MTGDRRGQVIMEFALSLIGATMFLYVLVEVWQWFNTMIVERQAAFERTRLPAGQRGPTAGQPVPYDPPRLSLRGTPNPWRDPTDDFPLLEPLCEDPVADELLADARALADASAQHAEEAQAWYESEIKPGKRLVEQRRDALYHCDFGDDDDDCENYRGGLLRQASDALREDTNHFADLQRQSCLERVESAQKADASARVCGTLRRDRTEEFARLRGLCDSEFEAAAADPNWSPPEWNGGPIEGPWGDQGDGIRTEN